MTEQPRITIDAPSDMVILAARHLDATEGPVQVGATVDTATRAAITTVLRYIAKAHNQTGPAATEATEPCGQTGGADSHPPHKFMRGRRLYQCPGGTAPAVPGPEAVAASSSSPEKAAAEFKETAGTLKSTAEPAPAWTPPPPSSTDEQLPDAMLDLIRDRLPDYLSTACQTADTLACAACYPGSGIPRPEYDEIREHAERLHNRCRINHKFTGQICRCFCHQATDGEGHASGGPDA